MNLEIQNMYTDRLSRSEIKKLPTQTTINKHCSNVQILDSNMCENNPQCCNDILFTDKDFPTLLTGIQSLKGKRGQPIGLSTQQAYLFSTLVAMRTKNPDNYYQDQLWIDINKYLNDKNGFSKQLREHKTAKDKVLPDYNKIKEAVDSIFTIDSPSARELKLLLTIYMNYPFRLEVADLVYVPSKKDRIKMTVEDNWNGNYLQKHNQLGYYFIFNDYKTSDRYGMRSINVPKDSPLTGLINEQVKNNELKLGDKVFGNLTRNTMTQRITKFFEKTIGEKVSPTDLTKLLIQREYEKMPDDIKETQKRLAGERGHSISTQIEVYLYS